MLISFVSGQAVYAGALDNVLPVVFNQSVSMGKEAEVSNMTYDICGRLAGQTSIDLEGGNANPVITRDITYNAAGQRTLFITEGKTKEGQTFFESRTGMKYNADGELSEYYSSGNNNGYSYNKHLTNIAYDEKGRMSSYNETGLTSDGVSYNENHSGMVYDEENRVTQERVSGTRAGEKIDETTKTQYNAEGRVTYTETRSNISKDYSTTSNISYDARGNRTGYTTQGSKDGKAYSSTTKAGYAFVNGYDRLVSKVESGTRSDGKAYTDSTSGYSYNSAGQLKAYTQNVEIRGDTDYVKKVSNIEYNSLGQTTSMTYTDSRNNDFKVHGNTITENYSYNSNGKLSQTTMTTPDYVIRYDGNGKQIGEAQETAGYRQWRENEEARAYQEAREQAEAELLNGLAGSTVILDANNQPVNNALVAQMLGGSGMYGNNIFMSSMGMMNTGKIASFTELMGTMGKGNNQAISLQLAQYATAIAPQQYQAALQTAITREMIAAKVNEKTANLRQELMNVLTRAIAQAIPSNVAKMALLAKIKQSVGSSRMFDKSGALVTGTQMIKSATGNRFYVNGKEVSKAEYAKNAQLKDANGKTLDLMQELDMSSPEVAEQRCKQLQQALGKNAANIAWPLKVCSYDDNGRLQGLEEFSLDSDGKTKSTHIKREYKSYDEAGYLNGHTSHESFKGPNGNYQTDTKFNDDGSSETHVYGTIKNEKTGQQEKVDRSITSRVEAFNGGFTVISEEKDNLTGLKCSTTDKYTGCQYSGKTLIGFNLEHNVSGQRMQDGVIQQISIQETVRQYDAQVDGAGRVVSYRQDTWSNSSPDKRTTSQYNNHEFDDQNRVKSQTIQTWENGKGTDGAGKQIELNSYTVKERTNIEYNNAGQIKSYNETTYTQEKNTTLEQHERQMGSEAARYVEQGEDGKPVLNKTKIKEGYESQLPSTTMMTQGGMSIKGSEGYHWKSETTSQSNMQYDYAGRVSFWQDARGKATHQTYDVNGLVDTSYSSASKTRTYDVKYDSVGRKTEWSSKTSADPQSYYGKHKAEYNALGQVVSQIDQSDSVGKFFRHHEKTQTFYSYDAQGNQKESGTTLFYKSHDKHSFFTRMKQGDSRAWAAESPHLLIMAISPDPLTLAIGTTFITIDGMLADFQASNPETFSMVTTAVKTVCSYIGGYAYIVYAAVVAGESTTMYANGMSSSDAMKHAGEGFVQLAMSYACSKIGESSSMTQGQQAAAQFAVTAAGTTVVGMIRGDGFSESFKNGIITAAINWAIKWAAKNINKSMNGDQSQNPGNINDVDTSKAVDAAAEKSANSSDFNAKLFEGIKAAAGQVVAQEVAKHIDDPQAAAIVTGLLNIFIQGMQKDYSISGADGKMAQEALKGVIETYFAGRVDENGNLSKDENYMKDLLTGIAGNIDFKTYFNDMKEADAREALLSKDPNAAYSEKLGGGGTVELLKDEKGNKYVKVTYANGARKIITTDSEDTVETNVFLNSGRHSQTIREDADGKTVVDYNTDGSATATRFGSDGNKEKEVLINGGKVTETIFDENGKASASKEIFLPKDNPFEGLFDLMKGNVGGINVPAKDNGSVAAQAKTWKNSQGETVFEKNKDGALSYNQKVLPADAKNVKLTTDKDGNPVLTYTKGEDENIKNDAGEFVTEKKAKTFVTMLDAKGNLNTFEVVPGATDLSIGLDGMVRGKDATGKEFCYQKGSTLIISQGTKKVPVVQNGVVVGFKDVEQAASFMGSFSYDKGKVYTYNSKGEVGSKEVYVASHSKDGSAEYILHSTEYNTDKGSVVVGAYETALFNGMGGIDSIVFCPVDLYKFKGGLSEMVNLFKGKENFVTYYERDTKGNMNEILDSGANRTVFKYTEDGTKTVVDYKQMYGADRLGNKYNSDWNYQKVYDTESGAMSLYDRYGNEVNISMKGVDSKDSETLFNNNLKIIDIVNNTRPEEKISGIYFAGGELRGVNQLEISKNESGENIYKRIFVSSTGERQEIPLGARIEDFNTKSFSTSNTEIFSVVDDKGKLIGNVMPDCKAKTVEYKNGVKGLLVESSSGYKEMYLNGKSQLFDKNTSVTLTETGFSTETKINVSGVDCAKYLNFDSNGKIVSGEIPKLHTTFIFKDGELEKTERLWGAKGDYWETVAGVEGVQNLRDKDGNLKYSLQQTEVKGEKAMVILFPVPISEEKQVVAFPLPYVTDSVKMLVGTGELNDVSPELPRLTEAMKQLGLTEKDNVNFYLAQVISDDYKSGILFSSRDSTFVKDNSADGEKYGDSLNKTLAAEEFLLTDTASAPVDSKMQDLTRNEFGEMSFNDPWKNQAIAKLGQEADFAYAFNKVYSDLEFQNFAKDFMNNPLGVSSEVVAGFVGSGFMPEDCKTYAVKMGASLRGYATLAASLAGGAVFTGLSAVSMLNQVSENQINLLSKAFEGTADYGDYSKVMMDIVSLGVMAKIPGTVYENYAQKALAPSNGIWTADALNQLDTIKKSADWLSGFANNAKTVYEVSEAGYEYYFSDAYSKLDTFKNLMNNVGGAVLDKTLEIKEEAYKQDVPEIQKIFEDSKVTLGIKPEAQMDLSGKAVKSFSDLEITGFIESGVYDNFIMDYNKYRYETPDFFDGMNYEADNALGVANQSFFETYFKDPSEDDMKEIEKIKKEETE